MKLLNDLKKWFLSNNLSKLAQEIDEFDEYAEPWHQEAVEEFGDEPISEEEYIKDVVVPGDYSNTIVINEIFKKEKFQTVSAGGKSSYLGAGFFGKVNRGIYQGKPAVAKVILVDENTGTYVDNYGFESDKWNMIESIKDKISPKFQVHIPQVYLSKHDYINVQGEEYLYEIIIMEELKPLNKHLKNIISQLDIREELNRALNDEDFLYDLSKIIVLDLQEKFNFEDLTPEEIFYELYHLGSLHYKSENQIIKRIGDYVSQFYNLSYQEQIKVRRSINLSLALNFIEKEGFPKDEFAGDPNSEEYNPLWQNLPETRQLLNFLQELAKLGLSWADIKENNLMMDYNGNIKIIDLGLYKINV